MGVGICQSPSQARLDAGDIGARSPEKVGRAGPLIGEGVTEARAQRAIEVRRADAPVRIER
jgi:hypothetical protein